MCGGQGLLQSGCRGFQELAWAALPHQLFSLLSSYFQFFESQWDSEVAIPEYFVLKTYHRASNSQYSSVSNAMSRNIQAPPDCLHPVPNGGISCHLLTLWGLHGGNCPHEPGGKSPPPCSPQPHHGNHWEDHWWQTHPLAGFSVFSWDRHGPLVKPKYSFLSYCMQYRETHLLLMWTSSSK